MQPRSRPDGLALGGYYSAASIHIALSHQGLLPRAPWWSSTDPDVHLGHARNRDAEGLADDLVMKYRLVAERASETDPGPFLSWFQHTIAGLGTSSELPMAKVRGLMANIPQEVLAWTRRSPRPGAAVFLLWYADESVRLAQLGGYSNPARNDIDPRPHLEWAARTPLVTVIRDLVAKAREQYERRQHVDEAECLRYTAQTLARAVAWGGVPPSLRSEISVATPVAWEAWCLAQHRDHGMDLLGIQLARIVRATALALIDMEREALPANTASA